MTAYPEPLAESCGHAEEYEITMNSMLNEDRQGTGNESENSRGKSRKLVLGDAEEPSTIFAIYVISTVKSIIQAYFSSSPSS